MTFYKNIHNMNKKLYSIYKNFNFITYILFTMFARFNGRILSKVNLLKLYKKLYKKFFKKYKKYN